MISRYAFSRNRQPTIVPIPNSNVAIGRATQMSRFDILRINRLYGCKKRGKNYFLDQTEIRTARKLEKLIPCFCAEMENPQRNITNCIKISDHNEHSCAESFSHTVGLWPTHWQKIIKLSRKKILGPCIHLRDLWCDPNYPKGIPLVFVKGSGDRGRENTHSKVARPNYITCFSKVII
uniref:Peptidase M12A domain-containing protein n=1 Tax=Anguilla anguilla TaxID=7936 RepID=A0A0E9XTM2_ANGAN